MNRHLRHTCALFMLFTTGACAQVFLDKPLVLSGSEPEQRRVTGLGDPQHEGQAVSAGFWQSGVHSYAAVSGDDWMVDLQPEATTVEAGMELVFRSAEGNAGPVSIMVGDAGPFPLYKEGGLPLDSADLHAGQMISAVFDGFAFQLTSGLSVSPRPCPEGFVAITERFCMETDERPAIFFRQAAVACGQIGARLCTWGEFFTACWRQEEQGEAYGLQDMVGNWEWTNNTANGDGLVRVVGQATCTHANTSPAQSLEPRNYRCCYRR